jgi:HlyD family secretion protein
LPSAALVRREGKVTVFVVRDDVAHEVPVTVGMDNGAQAEVISGLKADELVVLHPDRQLRDGQAVRAQMTEVELGK